MMLYPAMNKLTQYIPNRYMMVNVVARRARQIAIEAQRHEEHLDEKPVTQAINEIKAGKVEYRLDKTNIIHCPIGKVSFGADKLYENYTALLGAIIKAKPAAAKGQYIKSCVVASTMGPGIKMSTAKL